MSEEELPEFETIQDHQGGNKKRVIALAGALFLVCNLAWGAAWIMLDGSEAEAAAPPASQALSESAPEEAPSGEGEEGEEPGAEPSVSGQAPGPMFKLDPFVVNLDEPRGTHYLRVAVELEVKDEEAVAGLEGRIVVLRDRFISALSSKRLSELARPKDKDALKEELLDLSRDITGDRSVKRVYFTEFLTQ